MPPNQRACARLPLVPESEKLRWWTDWSPAERGGYASLLVVEIALVLLIVVNGGRAWAPLVVIAGWGALYVYDLVVQRHHETHGS